MPHPIALCLENVQPSSEDLRYIRCVALSGAENHVLSLRLDGTVHLGPREEGSAGCLWVSSDDRLAFWRPADAAGWAQVHRAGRHVDVPVEKPVMVLDGDHIVIPGFCYRLHVHGPAQKVHEPEFLDAGGRSSPVRRLAAAGLMAAAVIGSASCAREKVVSGPAADPHRRDVQLPPPEEPEKKDADMKPIEIREHPPAPPPDDNYRNVRPGDEKQEP